MSIDHGQMICGVEDCTVSVKIDDRAVESMRAERPADGSSTMLFVSDPTSLLAPARTAHRIIMEAEFYQAGRRQFVFDRADGLIWDPPTEPSESRRVKVPSDS